MLYIKIVESVVLCAGWGGGGGRWGWGDFSSYMAFNTVSQDKESQGIESHGIGLII